jgi:hypothetical protein
LAVPLEDLGVALPEHEGNEVVGDTAGTESAGEGVPQMVQREMNNTSLVWGKGEKIPISISISLVHASPTGLAH